MPPERPNLSAPPRPPDDEPSLLATRASLLGRLKDLDQQPSWQDFFNTYWRLLFATARKAGLTPEESEDAVQDTFVAVAKHIGEFRYDPARCSFKSWLLLIARQRIIWQIRKRAPARPSPGANHDSSGTDLIDRVADAAAPDVLDRIWDEEWRKHWFQAAIDQVKPQVSARQFQIFDLHVLQNWPVAEVTRTLRVNAGQVYLAKHRVSLLLRKALRAVEKSQEKITGL